MNAIAKTKTEAVTPETALVRLEKATLLLAEIKTIDDAKHVMAVAEGAIAYARLMNMDSGTIEHAVGLRCDAARKLGGFLQKGAAKRGRPKKSASDTDFPTLDELGIKPHQAKDAKKVAKLTDKAFAWFRRERIESALGFKPKKPAEVAEDMGDECYTPEEWVERARKVMGAIDLDPFSCEAANKFVKADRFYTIEDNALDQEWRGRIWYQPPYSSPVVDLASHKLIAEIEAGHVTEGVGLTNTCSSSDWWQRLSAIALVTCFPATRISFFRPTTDGGIEQQKGNRADQTFFYFGNSPFSFEAVFGEVGVFGRLRGNLEA